MNKECFFPGCQSQNHDSFELIEYLDELHNVCGDHYDEAMSKLREFEMLFHADPENLNEDDRVKRELALHIREDNRKIKNANKQL